MDKQSKNSTTDEKKTIEKTIKEIIAIQIGVEPDDISEEDSLAEDLHMSAADLSELIENLKSKGIDASEIDFSEVQTIKDLIESLTSEELF